MAKKPRNVMDSLLIRDFLQVNGDAAFGGTANTASSGAVAIPIEELYSGYITNNTAALNASLADGKAGQLKIIKLITRDTNNLVVTPTNFGDGSTITFDTTGEVAVLVFDGSTWQEVYTDATVG